jgi:hypothetical protein
MVGFPTLFRRPSSASDNLSTRQITPFLLNLVGAMDGNQPPTTKGHRKGINRSVTSQGA